MLIVAYDFVDNKTRARFVKFLEQYGVRLQYSIFKIKNSKRVLNNITTEIEHKYKKNFKDTDSIMIFQVCERCEKSLIRYGYARFDVEDVIYFD